MEEMIMPAMKKRNMQNLPSRRIFDDGTVNIANLSTEELEKYRRLNSSLSVNDINSISSFGSELQETMAKYSNNFLSSVRTSKCDEIGTLIDNLLTELGYIDIEDFDDSSALKRTLLRIPVVNKLFKSVNKVLAKYDTIDKNVDTISKKITAIRMLALRDNNALQVMFDNNIEYGKQIEELIIAGKIKVQEIENMLKEMESHPENYDAYEIQDVQVFKNNLEKRLNDMLTLRYVIKQSLPQIRTVQYNNLSISDKAQSIISTTIPVWRNQLSISVALYNQKNSIEAQRKIADTTNKILVKNAEILKQNSIYAAQENERSVVDIETLRETTQKLIETLREVQSIHVEAERNRKAAEQEIIKIERELEETVNNPRLKAGA